MKQIGFVALWLIATCTAVAVAWAGVSVVDDEIVDPAPAREIAAAVAAGSSAIATSNPEADGAAATTTAPSSDRPGNDTPATTTTTRSVPTVTAPPTPTVTSPPTPTTPSPATTAPPPVSPSTTTTTTVAAPAQTQQFNLVGGSTAISFSATGVTVLWANPNPGFDVDIEPESPGWKVEFRSDDHRSRIDVWWSGGPRHEIREEAD